MEEEIRLNKPSLVGVAKEKDHNNDDDDDNNNNNYNKRKESKLCGTSLIERNARFLLVLCLLSLLSFMFADPFGM